MLQIENSSMQNLSAELLGLERQYQADGLNTEQQDRWFSVMDEWLQKMARKDERRRFCRFSYSARVLVRFQGVPLGHPPDSPRSLRTGMPHVLELVEIGNFGLQLKGDLASAIQTGDEVLWEAVEINGIWKPIAARCKAVSDLGPGRKGFSITNGDTRLQNRIRAVYYPAYIQALENMAAGTQLPS